MDRTFREADQSEFDALVIPAASPTAISCAPCQRRSLRPAQFAAGKPAAVICHGPWVLVEAGLVRGRTLTSWPSLKTDIGNAGGTSVDTEVQVARPARTPW